VTTLALYEDLLAPGERRPLAAASRVLFVASGQASSLGAGEAWFGDAEARVEAGHDGATVLRWELTAWEPEGAKVAARVELDPWSEYLMRCERVRLGPGATVRAAGGAGIACLLAGTLRPAGGDDRPFSSFDAWFDDTHGPPAAAGEDGAALVRVVLVPPETRPVDGAGARANVLVEEPVRV
jgi:hypothetical protein